MATQALYRKWRSQNFEEVVGQDHITRTLRNALRDGRLAHAYLFTGPRGTGKTSTARILAKAVNCEAPEGERPCNACRMCRAINEDRLLDLIEIDAASHTGVDNMRETVIDRVNFRPGEARFKFYIIDEVHMLSTSSFNALLKTLEEPPAHVIFVLATTDPQKVPATVISRCQRFDFHRIPGREIVHHLQEICAAEGIVAEPEALAAVARYATGCMRDAISLLDQLMAYGSATIGVQQVEAMLGTVPAQAIGRLIDALAAADAAAGLAVIGELVDQGSELRELARQTVEYLRNLLLVQVGGREVLIDLPAETVELMQEQAKRFPRADLVRAIRLFNEAGNELRSNTAGIAQLGLELAVVDAAGRTLVPPAADPVEVPLASRAAASPVASPEPAPAASPEPASPAAPPHPAPAEDRVPASAAASTVGPMLEDDQLDVLKQRWPQVKELLQQRRRMIVGILTAGVRFLAVEQNQVIIGYDGSKKQAQYNAQRLAEPDNKATLEAVLGEVLGGTYYISVMPEEQYRPQQAGVKAPRSPATRAADQGSEPADAAQDPLLTYASETLGAVVTRLGGQVDDSASD